MSQANNRRPSLLTVPGQVNFTVYGHPGVNAFPASVTFQKSNGVDVHTVGGLTKLESAAVQIASNFRDLGLYSATVVSRSADADTHIAVRAVQLARAVLAECAKAQQPPAQPAIEEKPT